MHTAASEGGCERAASVLCYRYAPSMVVEEQGSGMLRRREHGGHRLPALLRRFRAAGGAIFHSRGHRARSSGLAFALVQARKLDGSRNQSLRFSAVLEE